MPDAKAAPEREKPACPDPAPRRQPDVETATNERRERADIRPERR